jgi:hypothetical protein
MEFFFASGYVYLNAQIFIYILLQKAEKIKFGKANLLINRKITA